VFGYGVGWNGKCREKSRAKWEEEKGVALEIFSGSGDPKPCWWFSLTWVMFSFSLCFRNTIRRRRR